MTKQQCLSKVRVVIDDLDKIIAREEIGTANVKALLSCKNSMVEVQELLSSGDPNEPVDFGLILTRIYQGIDRLYEWASKHA